MTNEWILEQLKAGRPVEVSRTRGAEFVGYLDSTFGRGISFEFTRASSGLLFTSATIHLKKPRAKGDR